MLELPKVIELTNEHKNDAVLALKVEEWDFSKGERNQVAIYNFKPTENSTLPSELNIENFKIQFQKKFWDNGEITESEIAQSMSNRLTEILQKKL